MTIELIWNSSMIGVQKKTITIDKKEISFEEIKVLYEDALYVPWNEDSSFRIKI